jgi:Kdo2-lipid IVA lauroyltransferase/acyltransferase
VIREFLWRWGLAAARALARRLSPERRYRWAAAVGRGLGRVSRGHRRAVESNLSVIGAFAGRTFSADKVFERFALMLCDFLTDASPEVPVEGRERAEAARRGGKGVLFLTSHVGHWELGGRVVARWGWDVTAVYQPYKSEALQTFIRNRRAEGLSYLPVGRGAAAGVGRVLERGGAVALLADRPFGETGEPVDLCGRPARLPRGPFLFAVRHGAPIVPGFVLMEGPGRYRVVLEEPLWPSGKGLSAVKELLDRTARILEKYLSSHGDQWFCFEQVWRVE